MLGLRCAVHDETVEMTMFLLVGKRKSKSTDEMGGGAYGWSPSHDQRGMRRPFGTSAAEW